MSDSPPPPGPSRGQSQHSRAHAGKLSAVPAAGLFGEAMGAQVPSPPLSSSSRSLAPSSPFPSALAPAWPLGFSSGQGAARTRVHSQRLDAHSRPYVFRVKERELWDPVPQVAKMAPAPGSFAEREEVADRELKQLRLELKRRQLVRFSRIASLRFSRKRILSTRKRTEQCYARPHATNPHSL